MAGEREEELRRKAALLIRVYDEHMARRSPAEREIFRYLYEMLGELDDRARLLESRRPRPRARAVPARWER